MSRDERTFAAGLSDPAIPHALLGGELELLGYLPRSSNETFLVRATAEDQELLAVYKPRLGETPLWDFAEGTLCQREVAAYVVARELGWPNVPPTVLRDGPQGPGSVQLFVAFDPDHHYFTLADAHPDVFRRVALFDLVANNADRKAGHCLLGKDGRVFVIDHGVCFAEDPKLRTVIWDFAGEPIPAGLRSDLERLRGTVDADMDGALRGLLSQDEIRALGERIDLMLAQARFPAPGPGRPYPWPPI